MLGNVNLGDVTSLRVEIPVEDVVNHRFCPRAAVRRGVVVGGKVEIARFVQGVRDTAELIVDPGVRPRFDQVPIPIAAYVSGGNSEVKCTKLIVRGSSNAGKRKCREFNAWDTNQV